MWMACAYRVVLGGLSLAGGAQAVTVVFRAASESFPEQAFWALVSGALLTILMRGGIQAFERGAKVGMIAVSVFLAVALGLALGLPAVNPEPPLSGRWMDAFAAVVAALGLGTGMVSVSASYAEPRVPVPSSVAVVLAVRLLVVWIFSSIAARWGVAGGDAALATGAARHLAGESVGAAAAFALYAGAAILALVSACASAECVLAWLVDQFGAERGIASTVVGVGAAAMALVAAATVGATGTLRAAVAVGAVATGGFAIFSSWSLDPARAEAAFGESAVGSVFKLWLWLARVVVPLGAGAAFWAALT
jgi:SNF family Na+-dependent transporter